MSLDKGAAKVDIREIVLFRVEVRNLSDIVAI